VEGDDDATRKSELTAALLVRRVDRQDPLRKVVRERVDVARDGRPVERISPPELGVPALRRRVLLFRRPH